MEISFTKLSPNGQIVIPSEIRKAAGLKASAKFVAFYEKGKIILKEIKAEKLLAERRLMEDIRKGEEQIKKDDVLK